MGWFFNSDNDKDKQNNKKPQSDQPSSNKQNYEKFESVKSYSSSKSCHTDPENQEYMICTEKINDGGKINTKETRVHISQNNSTIEGFPSIFSHLWHFGDNSFLSDPLKYERVAHNRLEKLDKDLLNIEPSLLPFLMMFDAKFMPSSYSEQQSNKPWMTNHSKQRQQKSNKNQRNSHYFSSQQRDYQIKDL